MEETNELLAIAQVSNFIDNICNRSIATYVLKRQQFLNDCLDHRLPMPTVDDLVVALLSADLELYLRFKDIDLEIID